MTAEEAWRILDSAELVRSAQQVSAAVDRVAAEVTARLRERYPLVLSVMGGAVIFTGNLLLRLRFPLDFDYVHVTRYDNATAGGAIQWIAAPRGAVRDRVVLLVDDILDEGITLAAIKARLMNDGAAECYAAVLADKDIGRAKPIAADFVGMTLPNRYVFGFGMDVRGAWRNLPAIYALPE